MQKLWTITRHDLQTTFANRGIWLNLVVVPVALVLLIGVVNGGFATSGDENEAASLTQTRIDVLNRDEGDLGAALVAALAADPAVTACTPEDAPDGCALDLDEEPLDETLAQARADEGVTDALVVIPAGFTEAARAGDSPAVIYRAPSDLSATTPALAAVQSAVGRVGGALVAAEVGIQIADGLGEVRFEGYEDEPYPVLTFAGEDDRAAFWQAVYDRAAAIWTEEPAAVTFQFIDEEVSSDDGPPPLIGFRQSVPGMGSMYVMFTVLGGMTALLQERKNWTLQRLASMPVARWQILGGKMLTRFIMGMIQFAVVFVVGAIIGLRYERPLALLLVMMGFVALMTAFTFLLATVVESENQASGVSLFLALTLAPLGGAWWPLEIVPGWMQTVAMVSPVAWAMQAFSELLIYGRGLAAVTTPLAVLYGTAAVVFVLAVRRFRYV